MKAIKRTNKMRLLSMLLLLCMSVSLLSAVTFAQDSNPGEDSWQVSKSKAAAPQETRDADQEFTVNLRLPAAEFENMYDIVFVIDDSNSSSNANFREKAAELLEAVYAQECNVKVGVVGFKGKAQDIIKMTDPNYSGLTLINDDNEGIVLQAVRETSASGNGTNVHGGLSLAGKWLDEDTQTPDENKYIVLLTDCRSYIWDSADGNPTTIYAQYSQKLKVQNSGWPTANQIFNYDKNAYIMNFPEEVRQKAAQVRFALGNTAGFTPYSTYLDVFKGLYNNSHIELTGSTRYDTVIDFNWTWAFLGCVLPPDGSVTVSNISNTSSGTGQWLGSSFDYGKYYEFSPAADGTIPSDIIWLEMNPYEITENDDGTFSYDYTKLNEDCVLYHISNLEKGIYKAAHLWTDLNAKYNCCSVIYKKGSGSGLDAALGMRDWLLEKDSSGDFINSDHAADASDSESVSEMFEVMEMEIEYLINSGTLTDVIGDDFDLSVNENGDCPFVLTVGDNSLNAIADPVNAGKWNFTDSASPENILYSITYDPEGTDGETIVFDINVPVRTAEPVELSYKVKFSDPDNIESGMYPTNKYAKLDYESGDGTQGMELFGVPEVKYIKQVEISIPVEKTVTLGGNTAPAAESFEFEITPYGNPDADISGLTITGTEIMTDGAGKYTQTLIIKGDQEIIEYADGLKLTEKNDAAAEWTYDDAVYIVYWDSNDGILIQKDMGQDVDPEPVHTAIFTNEYTHNETNPEGSITVPFKKIVEQGGNLAPESVTFTFEIVPYGNADADISELKITGNAVKTNGKGEYEGTITISGNLGQIVNAAGLKLTEKQDGLANWKYDEQVYIILLDARQTEYKALIQKYLGPDKDPSSVQIAEFSNKYTKSSDQPVKPGPHTGDNSKMIIWLVLIIVSCGALVAVCLIIVKRKRKSK